MAYIPPRPTAGDLGDTEEVLYQQAVWDKLWGGEPLIRDNESSPLRVTKAADGVHEYQLKKQRIGASAGTTVAMYRLKSVQGDYITCKTWDGTTEGADDVLIAKPFKLRNSITDATIDGVSVTYLYPTTTTRTATASSVSENQVIIPRFLDDDLIFATTVNHTGVTVSDIEILKLDINADARAWARKYS